MFINILFLFVHILKNYTFFWNISEHNIVRKEIGILLQNNWVKRLCKSDGNF